MLRKASSDSGIPVTVYITPNYDDTLIGVKCLDLTPSPLQAPKIDSC